MGDNPLLGAAGSALTAFTLPLPGGSSLALCRAAPTGPPLPATDRLFSLTASRAPLIECPLTDP